MIRVIGPLLIVTAISLALYVGAVDDNWFHRRRFNRAVRRYMKDNPEHRANEPITWHCVCNHTDNLHTRWSGCREPGCACTLSDSEVRSRY